MFTATLIAQAALTGGDISAATDRLHAAGCQPSGSGWVEAGEAFDVTFGNDPVAARGALETMVAGGDVVVQPVASRAKRLLIADMDSTMIAQECIDELADYAGIKAQVADVTERAMRGELDFAAALDARVGLLAGLDEAVIERCLTERVTLMPGAVALVRTMRARGGRTILVSGGFTRFAEPVARQIGFDVAIANVLNIADGRLDGTVARPIVDAQRKQAVLEAAIVDGVARADTLAVGDGANDLKMIAAAGLGVAYHAKPITAAAADARIDHNDLGSLLFAQGIPRAQWVTA